MMSDIYLPAFNDYIRKKNRQRLRFFTKQDIQQAKTKNKQKNSSDQGNANQNPNGKKPNVHRIEQTKKLWYIVINSTLNSSLNE